MGWKSTIDITREQAINLILAAQDRKSYEEMTNEELENLLYGFGYGDDTRLSYYGYNFSIIDKENENPS